jgi:hypothetical protein
MRTGALRIDLVARERALLHWQQPIADRRISLALPSGCSSTELASPSERERVLSLRCDGDLTGRRFAVEGLGDTVSEATVLIRFEDGRTASELITKERPAFAIPATATARTVSLEYVALGLLHIMSGADHLLFLLLLVLSLRRPRAVLMAESAFTLSHSISFSAAALGWIHVSSRAAEACIALSLILVALDIDGARKRPNVRQGVLAAFAFGLVHGLGFAGGLSELGLPAEHVASALLGFAIGVELGQVAFLALALLIVWQLAKTRARPRLVPNLVAASGGLASFWFIERAALLLTP